MGSPTRQDRAAIGGDSPVSAVADSVHQWPLWDLSSTEGAVLIALLMVVLQHGGTAGIHAAMGRDGLLDHRRSEATGALRGTLALTVLMTPVVVAWAIDALSSKERMDVYVQANWALIAVYGPVTVIALATFLFARLRPWPRRSNLTSVVIGSLELARPWIAALGIAAATWVTRDPHVAIFGALAVVAGIFVNRATRRVWYSRPVELTDLGRVPTA